MKTVVIVYIILINLLGLILMGIDKQKAIHEKWRTPERVLFLVALLFGSIGILIGMYLFRHKTKKLRFSVGIPVIMALQILLVGLLLLWNNQQVNDPAQVVEEELDQIQNLDEETINSFISYESLMNTNFSSDEISSETADAMNEFFSHFSYSIMDRTVTENEALVTVKISNIDAHALAHDLCTEILKNSVEIYPDETGATTNDYYRLLSDTLTSNKYNTVSTTAHFHLQQEEHGWEILPDDELEDELVGGFISYINDPYILSASEVLDIHLAALKDLNADQWMQYLDIYDLFQTYNTEYFSRIDEEFVRQLTDSFDYEILECEENGSDATAQIRIESIDMFNILSNYKDMLLEYASSSESTRDDSVTFSNKTSSMLLDALEENTSTTSTDIEMEFSNNGYTWEVYFDDSFTNALMGDIDSAIETFLSSNSEVMEAD